MNPTPPRPVYLHVHDGIGEIVLNRPEKRNALHLEMWSQLAEAVAHCDEDANVEIVLLRSSDLSVFCAGADISEFSTVRSDSTSNARYKEWVQRAVMGLRDLTKPTIAMISGPCVGGGTELAVACDIRFASDTARLGITPAKLGFVYDVAETRMLIDLVGPSRAKDILFSARLLDAEEALRIGLVDRVIPVAQLEEETYAYIRQLTQNAPNSLRGAKAIINALVAGAPTDDPSLQEIVRASLDSPHYQEGVRAFIEKRRPHFPRLS